ncbi:AlbA family DNA-binding domain-containing protein [Streptosporangium sp. CA-115845]|uniref:AlbA family DNA-binding domain-containing protein n=1 Tax=Streptosporangium sp. CA-115845 TaxID=3240071 RepID=UPI003D92096E
MAEVELIVTVVKGDPLLMLHSPRRLEALLGAPLPLVTYAQIAALVDNPDAREAEDLDYKVDIPDGDKERREKGNDDVAVDVATFANHTGGLIIVGMADVGDIPSKALDVRFQRLQSRIRNAVATRVHPMPRFAMREVPNPANPGHGFLLISIPPSSQAPHAVSNPVQKNESPLRWPRRHGADKVWLSESEIAAAYRRRLMGASDQVDRLRELEDQAVMAAAVTSARQGYPRPLLVVTVVPDLPGDLLLDGTKVRDFDEQTKSEVVMLGAHTVTFDSVSVAHRRLIAEAGATTVHAVRAQLYTDGSATFAIHPTAISPAVSDKLTVCVLDAEIVSRTASALRYLARHARDRAAAAGSAMARVMLVADTHLHPVVSAKPELETAWPFDNPDLIRYRVDLNTTTRIVDAHRPLGTRFIQLAFGESAVSLDDLADDGQPLARATAALCGDLFQAYGVPENQQIRRDGTINPHAWGGHWDQIKKWAEKASIPLAAED